MTEGFKPVLSSEQIAAHLASCFDCRQELAQLRALSSLLDRQERRQRTEQIWTSIEGRLPEASLAQGASPAWRPFMLLSLLLLGYRLVEMILDRDFGLVLKLVPVLFIVATFSYLKENPFKINAELRLEGE